jgi:hypothetical protein
MSSPKKTHKGSKDLEESINNLYWLEALKLPSLWYGDLRIQAKDSIHVDVIGHPDGADGARVSVKRGEIIPLEYGHLRQCRDRRLAGETAILSYTTVLMPTTQLDYCSALMDFSEWDNKFRDSYWWADPISSVFLTYSVLTSWLDSAETYLFAHKFKSRRHLYLYILSAQTLGIIDEYQQNEDGIDVYSDSMENLMDSVLNQFKDRSNRPLRTCCRVSDNCQVAMIPDVDVIGYDSSFIESFPCEVELEEEQEKDLSTISEDDFVFANRHSASVTRQMDSSFESRNDSSASKETSSSRLSLCLVVHIDSHSNLSLSSSTSSHTPTKIKVESTETSVTLTDGALRWTDPLSSCVAVNCRIRETRTTKWNQKVFSLFLSGLKKYSILSLS